MTHGIMPYHFMLRVWTESRVERVPLKRVRAAPCKGARKSLLWISKSLPRHRRCKRCKLPSISSRPSAIFVRSAWSARPNAAERSVSCPVQNPVSMREKKTQTRKTLDTMLNKVIMSDCSVKSNVDFTQPFSAHQCDVSKTQAHEERMSQRPKRPKSQYQ